MSRFHAALLGLAVLLCAACGPNNLNGAPLTPVPAPAVTR